jgi:hypothetical protein
MKIIEVSCCSHKPDESDNATNDESLSEEEINNLSETEEQSQCSYESDDLKSQE